MKILKITDTPADQVIKQVVKTLTKGGLIIFPTETTYGAGVDATNPRAVKKLLKYKSRREGKPLSIAVTSQKMAIKYVEINQQAKKLYRRFLPGPVTVVSKSRGQVTSEVESEFGTLGVRIPDYPLIIKLLKKFNKPITATSANASGRKRPYTIQDIFDNLSTKQKKLIDLVIDAGQLPDNPPSTVIDTTLSTPTVLRNGSLGLQSKSTTKHHKPTVFNSNSELETQEIAGKLCLKHWDLIKTRGWIVGLSGKLGAGKTIFAKGVARFLQIGQTITSPTYTYIEEYDYNRHGFIGKFFHLDMWKINSQEELERFKIDDLIRPKNVIVIEWWDQIRDWRDNTQLRPDLVVKFKEKGLSKRSLEVAKYVG